MSERPYNLTGKFQLTPERSSLSVPYNLRATFDKTAGGETRAIGAIGFNSNIFGSATAKYTQFIFSAGINQTIFGTPGLINKSRHYNINGFNASAYGQPSIQNLKRYLNPMGLNASNFGQAKIQSLRSYLTTVGQKFEAFGVARISYREQKVTVSGINATVFGNQMISDAVRTIEMVSTNSDMSRFGTQWIEYNPRYILPTGIFEQLPSNHMVSPKIFIRPEGFNAARFGTRIIPEIQTIYPQGFIGALGTSEVYNHRQYIQPKGFLTVGEFPEYRWGRAEVWNQTQVIQPIGIDKPNLNLPDLERTKIFNLNRVVTTHGALHQRFGYQQIENNGRVLSPIGIASHIEVNPTKTTVTDRIRFLKMSGIESPLVSTWHHARLGARLIQPKGLNASIFGSLQVENTRRVFRFIGMGDQSRFGQAMISDAVRTLSFEYRYTIAPLSIPLPTVKLGTRYIEAAGIDSLRMGWHEAVIHWNKIYPRFEHKNRIGEPIVRNVTPELRMRGLDMSEFGVARINLYTRYIRPDGLNSVVFGQNKISDSKQFIQAIGIAAPVITRFHEVVRLGGQYIPQMIDLSGQGIETKNFTHGYAHRITQNVIRTESTQPMTLFGSTVVTANTIRVEPGYWEILFGAAMVSHKNRQISVAEFKDVFEPSKPRLSPHTIYAGIVNPPQQAVNNHTRPELPLHPIDGFYRSPGAVFGVPSVTHFHRQIFQQGNDLSLFGGTDLKQANFYIRPKGWNSLRVGMIGPIGDQKINLRKGLDLAVYGQASVQHVEPFNRTIKIQGEDWLAFGSNEAQLLVREINPVGLSSLRMGTGKDDDQPYMWQGLRVGEHVPTCIGGGDLSEFGTAWISLRVREINPVGLDYALVNEYDYTELDQRMRVVRQEREKTAQHIQPSGFNASMFSASDIKNKVHYIRPDGNAEQFRKGAF